MKLLSIIILHMFYWSSQIALTEIWFFKYLCHMLPIELWKTGCKSSSLFVDRKYEKGNQRVIA
jgi:hypothetical protein